LTAWDRLRDSSADPTSPGLPALRRPSPARAHWVSVIGGLLCRPLLTGVERKKERKYQAISAERSATRPGRDCKGALGTAPGAGQQGQRAESQASPDLAPGRVAAHPPSGRVREEQDHQPRLRPRGTQHSLLVPVSVLADRRLAESARESIPPRGSNRLSWSIPHLYQSSPRTS
jgi:hypothetical protein